MNKIYLIFICILLRLNLYSQVVCGTTEYINQCIKENPQLLQKINDEVKRKEDYLLSVKNNSTLKIANADITIPVVVNVIYKNESENISDAVIQTQIDQLNLDFNKLNNQSNVPSGLQVGEPKIQFCLQKIFRKQTTVNRFILGQNMGAINNATTGLAPYLPSTYLNIYVADLWLMVNGVEKNRLGGFTASPAVNISASVFVDYNYFGKPGVNSTSFGHFTTHEVGHWLGLCHPHDSPVSTNCVNISNFLPPYYVTTPPNSPNFYCNNSLNYTPYYMNFMEYSGDDCISMFTEDQVTVMRSNFVNGAPLYSMVNPTNTTLDQYRCSKYDICNRILAISNIGITYNYINSVSIFWDKNSVYVPAPVNNTYFAIGYLFRYRIVGGVWSNNITLTDPTIKLDNLINGNYEFQVVPIYPNCDIAFTTTNTFSINSNAVCSVNKEPNNNILDAQNNLSSLIRATAIIESTINSITINDRIDNEFDVDWYSIKTNSGFRNLKVTLTPPSILGLDYDLEIYDCKGNLIRVAANNPNSILQPPNSYYYFFKEYFVMNNIEPESDYYIKIIDRGNTIHSRMCYMITLEESLTPFENF
jgi:hypothetical protein